MTKRPRGRQTVYTPEAAAEICARLAKGESLRSICKDEHIPEESTVREWVLDDREGFAAHYTKARTIGYERMAEEILEIADEAHVEAKMDGEDVKLDLSPTAVARNRLRVDTRKWMLAKMLPKIYGDKVVQEHTGANGGPIVIAATPQDERI